MEREVSDANVLEKFANNFCRVIEKHVKYIIVSGFVVIASGRARGTENIDMIINPLTKNAFESLHSELTKEGFVCMQSERASEIFEYLSEKTSVRYTYKNELVPEMEVKFARDEIDLLQLKERAKLPFTGLDLWFSTLEANIAFKEEYLKSDKDIEDARHLRTVYSEQTSETKINHMKDLIRRLRQ